MYSVKGSTRSIETPLSDTYTNAEANKDSKVKNILKCKLLILKNVAKNMIVP